MDVVSANIVPFKVMKDLKLYFDFLSPCLVLKDILNWLEHFLWIEKSSLTCKVASLEHFRVQKIRDEGQTHRKAKLNKQGEFHDLVKLLVFVLLLDTVRNLVQKLDRCPQRCLNLMWYDWCQILDLVSSVRLVLHQLPQPLLLNYLSEVSDKDDNRVNLMVLHVLG